MVMADEADRRTMEAVDKSRTCGRIKMPEAVLNRPEARGSHGGARSRQGKAMTECWYYGNEGHKESKYWKKRADSNIPGSSGRDAERRQKSHYAEGSK